jgi:lipoate-protein ligase A
MSSWHIRHVTGDVAAFHARELPTDQRVATFSRAERPTLVLGSSQRLDSVDSEAADRHDIDIVRRRSGGGGVLLWPEEFVWLDLEIPASDEMWSDDVGRAMWWVGELWAAALADVEPRASVYEGRLQRTRWSSDICFAGTGPGEVMVDGAKLVGISQRRTRLAARFQTMVHLQWRPDVVASLVAAPPGVASLSVASLSVEGPSAQDLAPLVKTCEASVADITARLTATLQQP